MSYFINDIDLSTFGFTPGQAPGSNIAVEGAWDMPKRMGKLYHDWGDEEGVEPYVDSEDLRFEGRDIFLHGYIDSTAHLKSLKSFLKVFESLVKLSCPWGEWDVYLKGGLAATALKENGFEVIFEFREPVVDLESLGIPQDLQAVQSGFNVQLTWAMAAGATSYNVYRQGEGGELELVQNVNSNEFIDLNPSG